MRNVPPCMVGMLFSIPVAKMKPYVMSVSSHFADKAQLTPVLRLFVLRLLRNGLNEALSGRHAAQLLQRGSKAYM
jgi:hypothetical protein